MNCWGEWSRRVKELTPIKHATSVPHPVICAGRGRAVDQTMLLELDSVNIWLCRLPLTLNNMLIIVQSNVTGDLD